MHMEVGHLKVAEPQTVSNLGYIWGESDREARQWSSQTVRQTDSFNSIWKSLATLISGCGKLRGVFIILRGRRGTTQNKSVLTVMPGSIYFWSHRNHNTHLKIHRLGSLIALICIWNWACGEEDLEMIHRVDPLQFCSDGISPVIT